MAATKQTKRTNSATKAAKQPEKKPRQRTARSAKAAQPAADNEQRLTAKQEAFIEAYLATGFNGTKAAMLAGYAGDATALAAIAYENLRKPHIAIHVEERMKQYQMGAHETLMRLAEQARADLGEFADVTTASELARHPKSWLVKKMERTIIRVDENVERETIKIELHDSAAAVAQLLRVHGLYAPTKIAPTTPDGKQPYEPAKLTEAELDRLIHERLFGQPVQVAPG